MSTIKSVAIAVVAAACIATVLYVSGSTQKQVSVKVDAGVPVASPAQRELPFVLSNLRGGDKPIMSGPTAFNDYNYDPSVIYDNGVYRAYWCAGEPAHRGDNILYAEATSLSGPWHAHETNAPNSYDDVFWGTGNTANDGDFDGLHTCDPSVLKVNGVYYLYYTGSKYADAIGPNSIGVASSADGINWTRLNNGRPIVSPANKLSPPTDAYGAGEPTVAYAKDSKGVGWYYMLYNDHSGAATYPNGAGEYLIRATDPTFKENAETFTQTGWRTLDSSTETSHVVLNGINVDLQYVDLHPADPKLNDFLILSHRDAGETHAVLLDQNFNELADLGIAPTQWCEGPGLVSNADGRRAIVTATDRGWTISIDFLRAVGDCGKPLTWRLAWRGADLSPR